MTSLLLATPSIPAHSGSTSSDGRQGPWIALMVLVAVFANIAQSGPLLAAETRPSGTAKAGEPDFGPQVLIFDPSMTGIQSQIDAIFKKQESNQFGTHGLCLSLQAREVQPGRANGFLHAGPGPGEIAHDVAITGAVRSMAGWMKGNATCNFWRTIENLSVIPVGRRHVNVWAVSQGGALRRTHVKGDLHLWAGGWSSGGFMADAASTGR